MERDDDIQLLSLENIEVDRVATRVGFSIVVAKSRQNEVSSPPCHSDTPLAASGSILRIFNQNNVLRTNGLTDGQTNQRTDGHTLL